MALPGLSVNPTFITRTAEIAQSISLQCCVTLPLELIRIHLKMLEEQEEVKGDFRPPQCTSRYIDPTLVDMLCSLCVCLHIFFLLPLYIGGCIHL